ncbi:LamG domain-containing protein [Paenibacillus lentus]|uniref:LamG domain-containing protein n=1 Tax=Paenibacillus lentus TaxID=1338368 RepID=UPI003662A3AE
MILHNPLYTKKLMDRHGVAWYKMDGLSGDVIDLKGDTLGKTSGIERSLGWNGEGNSLKFNGTNSYVLFNQKVIPTGPVSIRFKVKCLSIPTKNNYEILANAYSQTNHFGIRCWITMDGGLVFFSCIKKANAWGLNLKTPFPFGDEWHDVLFTWDGTTNIGGVKLYIDNMVEPRLTSESVYPNDTIGSYNLTLGKLVDDTTPRFFNGYLDELEIYNEVIDPIPKNALLSSNNKIYSLNNGLINLPSTASADEQRFIDFGMNLPIEFPILNKMTNIVDTATTLGSGKTFEHTVDLSERRVDKIVLEYRN